MLASTTESWLTPLRQIDDAVALHVSLTPHAARESEALAWLNDEELSRWRNYRYDGPGRRFALCRAALRAVLCDQLGCSNEQLAFGAFEFGKPFAILHGAMAPISFSVSHSGGHGLIAYAPDGWLGVDIEERTARRNLDGLIEAALSPDEQAELAFGDEQSRLHAFFRLWTIKESLSKAVGLGVSLDMSQLEVPLAMRNGVTGGVFSLPQTPGVAWRLEDLSTESFAAAIAHEICAGTSA